MSADSTDLEASRDMLGLQTFLDIERARPNVTNAQHIQNKLIYDAVNEVRAASSVCPARTTPGRGCLPAQATRVCTDPATPCRPPAPVN